MNQDHVMVTGFWGEITTRDLPNVKQDC